MSEREPLAAGNPKIRRLRRLLGRRSSRLDEAAFVVEGPRLVDEALRRPETVELLLIGEDAPGAWSRAAPGSAVERHLVRAGVLERVLDSTNPQPIAAIVRRPHADLEVDVLRGPCPLLLVLDGISDPGNAGTLVRSAEGAGAAGVVFGAGSVDPFHPKVVRASGGSILRVPVVEAPLPEVLERLGAVGIVRVGAAARADGLIDDLDCTGPIALVLGHEAHGLSNGIDPLLDRRVGIPLAGPVDSLNVAMAGTVLLFEAARQRRRT